MSVDIQAKEITKNYNDVYNYVKEAMMKSQVKLNDSGVKFLEDLASALNSENCRINIPTTTHDLPPLHAEVKYKTTDGLRLKLIKDNSFILLTPLAFFVIMKHDNDVYALTYPLLNTVPDEDDLRIMSVTLVDMGTSILEQINQTNTKKV